MVTGLCGCTQSIVAEYDNEIEEQYQEEAEALDELEEEALGSDMVTTNDSKDNDGQTVRGEPKFDKYVVPQLVDFEIPGVFTMQIPKGWRVYKTGEYNTLAYIVRDESQPLRQLFFFSEIGLFYVSSQQKAFEIDYMKNNGYLIQWIDMPVVEPFDGTTFFNNLATIFNTQIGQSFLSMGGMPLPTGIDQFEAISEVSVQSIYANVPAVLLRGLLVKDQKIAQGLFSASGVEDGQGHATALLVTGISAPIEEFSALQETLLTSLKSFTLDEDYVRQGMNMLQENGERLASISQTLSQTSDIVSKGWTTRQPADDVRIQKNSDGVLGVERVYDPNTGDVYEVNNGFYDYYQTHQADYPLKNLQPLGDQDYPLWEKAPLINHGMSSP